MENFLDKCLKKFTFGFVDKMRNQYLSPTKLAVRIMDWCLKTGSFYGNFSWKPVAKILTYW